VEIKRGDLVQIVKPRLCGCADNVGQIFIATETMRAWGRGFCPTCHKNTFCSGVMVASGDGDRWHEFSRLKKIDPPSTGELKGVPLRLKEPV